MICDLLTLDQLKALTGTPTLSDEALVLLYDTTLDYIFNFLGHSFGLGMRIWHDGTGGPDTWNVEVTSTGVTLTTTSPVSTTTLTFATYTTLADLAIAIETLTGGTDDVLEGWEAEVIFAEYGILPSSTLTAATISVPSASWGYENRQLMCLSTYRDSLSGNGQSRLPLTMKAASITQVCEDNTVLTEGTDFWLDHTTRAVLIKRYDDGSTYCPYTVDYWSVAEPNNVVVDYVPLWWRARPSGKLRGAVRGLMMLALTTTGYKSEKIGDYSYTQDSLSAAMWLEALADYISPMPATTFWIDP